MTFPTLGSWLCRTLAVNGVETVFGIPGVHTVELYRGLGAAGLRHVTPRHEQGAGFMADGYARVTGRPGVCFVITGPGLTNIATAVGQAYGDSIPMLVISTVSALGAMGSGAGHLHELPDQRQMMAQLTAFSHTVLRPQELPVVLARAFAIFASARPRPVHIEIPVDLLASNATDLGEPLRFVVPSPPTADDASVDGARDLAVRAARPLIVAGGGAQRASYGIRRLAEALDAPVLMTTNGRGILSENHPLAVPVFPGAPAAQQALNEADLLLALGTEMGPTDFGKAFAWQGPEGARVIRCDLDPEQLMHGRLADVPVLGDVADFVDRLLARLQPAVGTAAAGPARAAEIRTSVCQAMPARALAALALVEILRDSAPRVIIAGDSAQPVYAACRALGTRRPGEFFCSATGYGTLGYGLPAAIGAALGASGETQVFSVMGDGGLQFTLPEMGSAIEVGVSPIMVLWNNHGYGEIKDYMEGVGIAPLGVDIHTPDFTLLARGYGWAHLRADTPDALRTAISKARSDGGPTVIEVNETAFVVACTSSQESTG